MIHLRTDFFSEALGRSTSMTVLMPQTTQRQIGLDGVGRAGATPVLYLLHGMSDDATTWTRHTSLERYAAERGIAVVMPMVDISFYADEVWGANYWTFVSQELPALVTSTFQVSNRREDTFVAGLSMGGFGAFKLALNRPDRFAAAASLSGALDMVHRLDRGFDQRHRRRIWGDAALTHTIDDLPWLVSVSDPESLPELYLACGTEDALLEDNERFIAAARARDARLTVDLRTGGHDWAFWDAAIRDVLDWLPLVDPTDTWAL